MSLSVGLSLRTATQKTSNTNEVIMKKRPDRKREPLIPLADHLAFKKMLKVFDRIPESKKSRTIDFLAGTLPEIEEHNNKGETK